MSSICRHDANIDLRNEDRLLLSFLRVPISLSIGVFMWPIYFCIFDRIKLRFWINFMVWVFESVFGFDLQLYNRAYYVCKDGSNKCISDLGVTQSFMLGPLLSIIFIYDLPEHQFWWNWSFLLMRRQLFFLFRTWLILKISVYYWSTFLETGAKKMHLSWTLKHRVYSILAEKCIIFHIRYSLQWYISEGYRYCWIFVCPCILKNVYYVWFLAYTHVLFADQFLKRTIFLLHLNSYSWSFDIQGVSS